MSHLLIPFFLQSLPLHAELLVLGSSLYINWKSLSELVASEFTFTEWLVDNLLIFVNFVILVPSASMVLGLWSFHTYLAR